MQIHTAVIDLNVTWKRTQESLVYVLAETKFDLFCARHKTWSIFSLISVNFFKWGTCAELKTVFKRPWEYVTKLHSVNETTWVSISCVKFQVNINVLANLPRIISEVRAFRKAFIRIFKSSNRVNFVHTLVSNLSSNALFYSVSFESLWLHICNENKGT